MKYDYLSVEVNDVENYLNENHYDLSGDHDELLEEITDRLMLSDEVTGNASGSYTFNTMQAEQNLVGNWNLLEEAVSELAPGTDVLSKGAEWCDVLIRIYLLDQAVEQALENF